MTGRSVDCPDADPSGREVEENVPGTRILEISPHRTAGRSDAGPVARCSGRSPRRRPTGGGVRADGCPSVRPSIPRTDESPSGDVSSSRAVTKLLRASLAPVLRDGRRRSDGSRRLDVGALHRPAVLIDHDAIERRIAEHLPVLVICGDNTVTIPRQARFLQRHNKRAGCVTKLKKTCLRRYSLGAVGHDRIGSDRLGAHVDRRAPAGNDRAGLRPSVNAPGSQSIGGHERRDVGMRR